MFKRDSPNRLGHATHMTETRTPNPDTFSKTVDFYQKANVILRIALFVAVLWPLAAIGTALFLTPENAQTIVPLVTLSPLVPMFLFILARPSASFSSGKIQTPNRDSFGSPRLSPSSFQSASFSA